MTARELIETLSSPFAVQESSENEIMNTASGSMNINQHDETELTLDSNSIKDFYELRYAILRSLNVHGELRILYDEIIHDNELNEFMNSHGLTDEELWILIAQQNGNAYYQTFQKFSELEDSWVDICEFDFDSDGNFCLKVYYGKATEI